MLSKKDPKDIKIFNRLSEELYKESTVLEPDSSKRKYKFKGSIPRNQCYYGKLSVRNSGKANIYVEGSNLELYIFDRYGLLLRKHKKTNNFALEIGLDMDSDDYYIVAIKNKSLSTSNFNASLKIYTTREDYHNMLSSDSIQKLQPGYTVSRNYRFERFSSCNPLKFKDQGVGVWHLQRKLCEAGFLKKDYINGVFNKPTCLAVEQMKMAYGFKPSNEINFESKFYRIITHLDKTIAAASKLSIISAEPKNKFYLDTTPQEKQLTVYLQNESLESIDYTIYIYDSNDNKIGKLDREIIRSSESKVINIPLNINKKGNSKLTIKLYGSGSQCDLYQTTITLIKGTTIEPYPSFVTAGSLIYDNRKYEIQIPNHNQSLKEFLEIDNWKTIKILNESESETSIADFIGFYSPITDVNYKTVVLPCAEKLSKKQLTMKYTGPVKTQQLAALSAVTGAIESYKNATIKVTIKIYLQRKLLNNTYIYRAIVLTDLNGLRPYNFGAKFDLFKVLQSAVEPDDRFIINQDTAKYYHRWIAKYFLDKNVEGSRFKFNNRYYFTDSLDIRGNIDLEAHNECQTGFLFKNRNYKLSFRGFQAANDKLYIIAKDTKNSRYDDKTILLSVDWFMSIPTTLNTKYVELTNSCLENLSVTINK